LAFWEWRLPCGSFALFGLVIIQKYFLVLFYVLRFIVTNWVNFFIQFALEFLELHLRK
jgi:hypothetical protein